MENVDLTVLAQKVCNEYDVEPETALEDVTNFINDLADKQLICRVEEK